MKRAAFAEALVGYEPHRAVAALRASGLTLKWEEDGDGGPEGFGVVRDDEGMNQREFYLDDELTAYLQGIYDGQRLVPSRAMEGPADG